MILDPERARELGKRSGQLRQRLDLERVQRELPLLDSPQHIRENYELVQRWACAGLLTAGVAGSCVRAADGALKLYEAELDRGRLKELEAKIKALESELAARRREATA